MVVTGLSGTGRTSAYEGNLHSHGPNLEFTDRVEQGDYVYIPAGVPHQPYNPTDKPARALIARTDPNEQESVVLIV